MLTGSLGATDEGFVLLKVDCSDHGEGSAQTITFTVVDTGAGMTAAETEKALKRVSAGSGRRSDANSVALGVASRYAHGLGGEVGLVSEEGRGSALVFRMPVRGEAKAPERDAIEHSGTVYLCLTGEATLAVATDVARSTGLEFAIRPTALINKQPFTPGDILITDHGITLEGAVPSPGLSALGRSGRVIRFAAAAPDTAAQTEDEAANTLRKPARSYHLRDRLQTLARSVVEEEEVEAPAAVPAARQIKTALVVEPDILDREVVLEALGDLNIDATGVEEADHAVAAYQSRAYDLVLVQPDLPRRNGVSLGQTLRAIEKSRTSEPLLLVCLPGSSLVTSVTDLADFDFRMFDNVTHGSVKRVVERLQTKTFGQVIRGSKPKRALGSF